MLRVLAIAAVAVAVYCLIEFLVYSEALAFATTYISQNHLWKIALPLLFPLPLWAAAGFPKICCLIPSYTVSKVKPMTQGHDFRDTLIRQRYRLIGLPELYPGV
ncbi:MAG: hypothetical protein ACLTW9_24720 [Enterocloster sp.]